jgi:hypothetical protein
MLRYMLFIFVTALSLLWLLACTPSEPQAESSDADFSSSPVAEVNAQVTKTTEPTQLLPTASMTAQATETTASFESPTASTTPQATETMASSPTLPAPTVTVMTTTPLVTESPTLLASPTIPVQPTVISTFNPYPEPIPTQTLIPVPPPPVATSWLTYTHLSGVSLQYPADWQVEGDNPMELVVFHPSGASGGISRMVLRIYDRPLEERVVTDPYTWQPNEGGYEVQWAKPISTLEAEGLQFAWGRYSNADGWQATLMAIYYSEPNELDIRLSTELDYESLQLVESVGFDEVIATRFQVFEQMAQSIVINR